MKLSESVKPFSYLKAHASEIVKDISENHKTFIITQNGEAKAVVQDLATYEETQESLALLKMLAQSSKSMKEGRSKAIKRASKELSDRIAKPS